MKKLTYVIAPILALALATTAAGCKSAEQIAESVPAGSTVISPDVNITQEAPDAPDTVTVSGSGKVTLEPDMVTVYISVNTDAETADEAQRLNSEAMEAVMASLKGDGVEDGNIKTSELYLSERYDYSNSEPEIVGYTMINTVEVTVKKNIENIGKIISNAIAAGATGTYGLTFGVDDTSAAYAGALKAAIEDARVKAEAIATALGAELSALPVSVTEVSTSQAVTYADTPRAAEAAAEDGALNDVVVASGESTVTARINAVFELLEPAV